MASFNVHLAIGKVYEKNNSIEKPLDFYNGIVDPDLVDDKSISHYTIRTNKDNLMKYLENKVILPEFLKDNNINSDYDKGVFLHLLTDYLFFNDFFDKDYLSSLSYIDFIKDLYYSYDYTNDYLIDKYKLDFKEFDSLIKNNISKDKSSKNINQNKKATNILDFNNLDKFINKVGNINLEEYRLKIIKNGKNVLP